MKLFYIGPHFTQSRFDIFNFPIGTNNINITTLKYYRNALTYDNIFCINTKATTNENLSIVKNNDWACDLVSAFHCWIAVGYFFQATHNLDQSAMRMHLVHCFNQNKCPLFVLLNIHYLIIYKVMITTYNYMKLIFIDQLYFMCVIYLPV